MSSQKPRRRSQLHRATCGSSSGGSRDSEIIPKPDDAELFPLEILTSDQVLKHRNLWCPFYDGCLDYAIDREWQSWSCSSCRYKNLESKPAPDGEARDRSRMEG